jgi:molybdenum cofactor guanylyltransferase
VALCSILRFAERAGWPFVATVSCDTPFIPGDIVGKLNATIGGHDCALAIWRGVSHPTCALWATAARAEIEIAFNSGERSLHHTIARLDAIEVDFSSREGGPNGDPFFNINRQADMAAAQIWLNEVRGAA